MRRVVSCDSNEVTCPALVLWVVIVMRFYFPCYSVVSCDSNEVTCPALENMKGRPSLSPGTRGTQDTHKHSDIVNGSTSHSLLSPHSSPEYECWGQSLQTSCCLTQLSCLIIGRQEVHNKSWIIGESFRFWHKAKKIKLSVLGSWYYNATCYHHLLKLSNTCYQSFSHQKSTHLNSRD